MPESNRAHSRVVLSTFDDDLLVEVVEECREAVGGKVSCVFAFASSDWAPHLKDFLEIVQVHGRAPVVVGSSGDGLIGVGQEDENVSGCSLLFLSLPNTKVQCTPVTQEQVDDAEGDDYWTRLTGLAAEEVAGWMMLSNPFELDAESWLKSWNSSYGEVACFGGIASGGKEPEEMFLLEVWQLRFLVVLGSEAS